MQCKESTGRHHRASALLEMGLVDRNHKTKQFSNQHLGYFNRGQHLHIKLNHQFQPEQMYFCLNGAEWSMGFEASFWRRWHRGKTPAKLCSAGSQPQQSALNTHVFPVYSHKVDEHKQKQHKGPPLMRVCLFLIASCLTLLSLTLGRLTQWERRRKQGSHIKQLHVLFHSQSFLIMTALIINWKESGSNVS